MYCPNCAAVIDETQKFCRTCGANVSLVPQALSGHVPQSAPGQFEGTRGGRRSRHSKAISIDQAATSFFTGVGFLFVALAVRSYAPAGAIWWFWLLIPAFATIGSAVGQYLKWQEQQKLQKMPQFNPAIPPPNVVPAPGPVPELSAPTTSELVSPASVTEHTTKHLDQSGVK